MFKGNCTRPRGRNLLLLISLLILTGCEASLKLEGVTEEQAKSSIRTDQYQQMVVVDGVITLVGSAGVVLTSHDEGQSWTRQVVEGAPNFIGITACPDGRLLALSFDRHLWSSTDQGSSWRGQELPTGEDLVGLTCSPDGSWWVAGSFTTLLKSTDQGENWEEQTLGEDALLTHISFFTGQEGVAAAEFGLFFKTTDGGRQWELIGNIGQELYPLTVYFSDPQQGWVGGLNGVIMHTEDGGQTWEEQPSGIESPIYSFFGSGNRLYASGDHGNVLSYLEGHWERIETPNLPIYISTGRVLSDRQLLVAGGWGLLLKLSPQLAKL